jgi:hypothetical protein
MESPWRHNLIAEGLRRMLAALVKRDPQGAPLAFWAVGTREEAWDDGTLPSKEARRTRTQLFNETGRRAIPSEQMTFLGGDFTNRLEISLEFTTAYPARARQPELAGAGVRSLRRWHGLG